MHDRMTWKEVKSIGDKHKKNVAVNCSEYHAHTAIGGCLCGDETNIEVCKLVEEIARLRSVLMGIRVKVMNAIT